ncbi:RNA repair transcriptional activator RtcR [Vibrio neptunius]|uniref:RNA repair transcriptional activator RtcR n=1 Tax=Vibrio neptunius TaxID=170651 RepID=A0ABS3A1Z1_9VIBR|nr:RNA repair transcriptional activator RtcR [Vibrio neptunius]MBN3492439.1 RNA repair transcriptional activator RtcR [Vibrio neptunius]MBN3514936.1 RNA repair transcriptional activator RtcR [Vibrio neptunius]MBN3548804.1 RNA repair transcriptional activator RtcR [Vibrio neptunius]MBN3577064.1 RNA repair transcriptional activator RtcR [Vibrio neptunius]MCH9870728.1 sigma 54-interacting transcriptional regulator [Vibrio neptunius]
MSKKTVAISLIGTQLDFVGKRVDRWARWRPNVSLCSQQDLLVDELYMLHDNHSYRLANNVAVDIESVSPKTKVTLHSINFSDPWDFEEVYAKLFDWCQQQEFDTDNNDYLFHITTGTHVVQICSYLLTESRHFPGRLIQTSPDHNNNNKSIGRVQIIDLDLSKYDQLATRFDVEHQEGKEFLKGGIETLNTGFNRLITQLEKVAIRSEDPMLLTGPTGAGKSQLATRIYQLKKRRAMLSGALVSVNCATLKGENAMAALFGHTKGAFTGAQKSRDGFLLTANDGVLFLDEIGELGLEEQAMLLHAIENKTFHPVGSDSPVQSDFQLIAGTNRDLKLEIEKGTFREDLLARINLWTYQLPALKDRKEDIPANVDYEIDLYAQKSGHRVQFNKEAKHAFISFATSNEALWVGNFRDLSSAITRLCTLADSSRISVDDVKDEIERLKRAWYPTRQQSKLTHVEACLSVAEVEQLDQFDANQLNFVLSVCRRHSSMASAGRELFNVSRTLKAQTNDSSRLQKYLAKFGLKWADL